MARRRPRPARTRPPDARSPAAPWVPAALMAAAFGAMAALTWRKWVDPFVDFGQQMEISREVSLGAVPYRDVALLHGPFSCGLQALLFRLFGGTIATLTTFNLAVVAGLAVLLFHLLERAFDRLAAAAGGLLFLVVFAFGQYTPGSITNYIAPYSPEIVHGLAFGLLAVAFASRAGCRLRPADAALAGLFAGLSILTKAEVSVAAVGGAAAGIGMGFLGGRRPAAAPARLLAPFAAGLAVPPFLTFLLFLRWLPTGGALRAAFGPWPFVRPSAFTGVPFFQWVAGTEDVAGNVGTLLLWAAAFLVVFGGAALWARRLGPGKSRIAFYAATGLLVAGLATTVGNPLWLEISRPLPLLLAAVTAFEAARVRRAGWTPDERALSRIPLALFALLLLLKTPLASRLYHYGQFLSMPGFLLAAGFLISAVPAAIDHAGGSGTAFRRFALALLVLVAAAALFRTRTLMAQKDCRVGSGPDRFEADERGCLLERARETLAARARPGDTLAVLPDGLLLNVLTGLPPPTRFGTLMPIEARVFGEEDILRAFEAHPPDWVVLADKDTSEYGPRAFGRDYLAGLGTFLAARYRPVARWGQEPFTGKGFGLKLLTRKK